MSIEKVIETINKEEIEKIYKTLTLKGINLDKRKKYYFTINKFEVFFRLYIDKDIQVYIRTNTLNSKEKISYTFVEFNTIKLEDIDEYKKNIKLFYKSLIKEVLNTLYCPEHHVEMIPKNASQEEMAKGWCTIYEQRLLTKLDYNNQEKFKEWINKVNDKKYILEQKQI